MASQTFGTSNCIDIAQIYPSPYSYGAAGPGSYIINNVVSGSTSYPAVNCSWYDTPSLSNQPTFQNDILHNAGGPFFGSYCVDVSSQDNNITSDPQFVNPAANDYHLKSTSPAIDAGENTVLAIFQSMTGQSLTTDFDGKPRVQNASGKGCTIDIGAYEYPGNVGECGTQETLTSSAVGNTSNAGQNVTFTAQLSLFSGVPTGAVQFLDGTNPLSTQTVSNSGSSAYSTSSLAVGSHTITANFQPTGTFAAASASLVQVVTGYATITTLACPANSLGIGGTALLMASVTSSNGTPTGSIAFTDNGTALATVNLAAGAASLTYTGTAATTHTITATYNPTGAFSSSSATCSVVVNPLPTRVTLSATPLTANAGAPVTLVASVVAAMPPRSGVPLPTGTVTFTSAGATVGTATLAAGSATLTLSTLPPGANPLSCQYAGDTIYSAGSCNTVTVTVVGNATALTLTASPGSAAQAFQPIALTAHLTASTTSTAPTGSIAFFSNGAPLGSAAVGPSGVATLTVDFPVGTDTLTATYAATSAFDAATSNSVSEVVTPDSTATTLTVSPNPVAQNTAVTLTAQVAPAFAQSAIPGTVAFFDGTASLGSVAVDASGSASFTSSAFAAGSHTLTAVYSGSTNDVASTSPPQTLTVSLQDFNVDAAPSLTIQTGHHADMNFTLASVGGFADTVAFSCLTLPQWATCTFASSAMPLGPNQTVTGSLHLETDAVAGYESQLHPPLALRTGITLALLAPLTLLIGSRRRNLLRRSTLLLVLLLTASMLSLAGCSSLYPPSVAPGTYTVTLAAQGMGTGVAHTAPFTLIVTQ